MNTLYLQLGKWCKKNAVLISISMASKMAYLKSFLIAKLFLAILIFILFKLYTVLLGTSKMFEHFTVQMLLYYVTITESIEFAKVRIFTTISEEIKDGTCAYNLLRPVSFLSYHFFSSLGIMGFNFILSLITGLSMASILTGFDIGMILLMVRGLPLMILAILINFGFMMSIGLIAFYIEEITPIYWVYQKFVFIAGGLLMPLELFPEKLRLILSYLPSSYMAYAPAKASIFQDFTFYIQTLLMQLIYFFAVYLLAVIIYKNGIKKVQINGG